MAVEVKTEVFDGPFDLLLQLIVREQVDLYDVSLSSIVDAYITEMARLGPLDLETGTEFLVIAATLIELKARRLLPGSGDSDLEDDLALIEERDLLLARLLECRTFSAAGAAFGRLIDTASASSPRTAGPEERFIGLLPDLLAGVSPIDLVDALVRALTPRPVPRVGLDHVATIRTSVRDTLADLVASLPVVGRTTFREVTAGLSESIDVVVHFLAVLELYKQGLVELEQAVTFGAMEITWLGADGADAVEAVLVGADGYGD